MFGVRFTHSKTVKAIIKRRNLSSVVKISQEIVDAVKQGLPIVALESTIISHGGLPYPKNLELAKFAEQSIRSYGAIPATCAVIDGVPKVGLSETDLEILSSSGKAKIMKASRRDLPYAIASNIHASTTVAGTMILAAQAGIHVFATGGIGGVHRGAELNFDISADLLELGRTPIAVVCAGIKSILDIPKTLEVLETQGVPVVGYDTSTFPSFFTNESGTPAISSPLRLNSPHEIASMIDSSLSLGLMNGMVVAVPNPNPYSDPAVLEQCIQTALSNAEKEGVSGAAITPYILAKVEALTSGKSLDSNIALYLNNAKVASLIAVALSTIRSNRHPSPQTTHAKQQSAETRTRAANPTELISQSATASTEAHAASKSLVDSRVGTSVLPRVVVIGGAARDIIASVSPSAHLKRGSSNPGSITASFGGVGRNISEKLACSLIDQGHGVQQVALCSIVGNDDDGAAILAHAASAGIDVSKVIKVDCRTARYVAVHGPDGDLVVSVADMGILALFSSDDVQALAGTIRQAELVVADGNISALTFNALTSVCRSYAIPIFFEPTSDHKCTVPVIAGALHWVDVMKPNVTELAAIIKLILENNYGSSGVSAASSKPLAVKPYSQHIKNRASVQNALASMSTASTASRECDIVDVRILAQALVQVMSHAAASSGSVRNSLTAEGKQRLVTHKHVVVSMGPRGVLWATESGCVSIRDLHLHASKSEYTVAQSADGAASVHIPCLPMTEGAEVNTNGAGDAFCAGLIGGMLQGGMGLEAVLMGNEAARRHILR